MFNTIKKLIDCFIKTPITKEEVIIKGLLEVVENERWLYNNLSPAQYKKMLQKAR